eukprot:gene12446-12583_t
MGDHDMPFWVALLVPFLVLLAAASAIEFWLVGSKSRPARVATFINVILGFMAAIAVVGFMTELFKRICGRSRPDFLDRCQPQEPLSPKDIAFGTFPKVTCTNLDKSILKDGHMSFPSGHSSCSMSIGLYTALYVLWCMYLRNYGALATVLTQPALSWAKKVKKELIGVIALLVVLFEIAWPWGVAASRFIDNRHNVSDVVAGLLLAASFAPIFVLRLAKGCSADSDLNNTEQPQLRSKMLHGTSHAEPVLPVVSGGGLQPKEFAAGAVELV